MVIEDIDVKKAFASRLKLLRDDLGLTQAQLGNLCGLHSVSVSRIERGAQDPPLSTLVRLATGMDLTLSELLEGV